MIEDWRERFHHPQLPFFFVLLAPDNDTTWATNATAIVRLEQQRALRLPNVGVANAIDLGDPTSPVGAVHSRNKSYVGERLARLARYHLLDQRDVPILGPATAMRDVRAALSADGRTLQVEVTYPEARHNDGLFMAATPNCTSCCDGRTSGLFLVQVVNASQHAFTHVVAVDPTARVVRANASWAGVSGRVGGGCGAEASVVSVRFEWDMYPQCVLYNSALLPSLPWAVDVAVDTSAGCSRATPSAAEVD